MSHAIRPFPDSPAVTMTTHQIPVALDYRNPSAGDLHVFVREFRLRGGEGKPYVIYLQGGPGFASPRFESHGSFLKPLLERFNVLLLDQRGTGLSGRIDIHDLKSMTEDERVSYLSLFRAPNIIQDVIALEQVFLKEGEQWLVLGQSFGGFCLAHYLSTKPDRIAAGMFTGGIPPLAHIDKVHERTYRMVERKSQRLFKRFPEIKGWLDSLAAHIREKSPTLPCGDRLTIERFRQLGMWTGQQTGEQFLYYLLEMGAHELSGQGRLSHEFLRTFDDVMGFVSNPLYGLLIEPCYADAYATEWSAQRIGDQLEWFSGEEFRFTGEMVFPWVYEQHGKLSFLAGTADRLAHKPDWEPLYDREALASCEVPLAAAIYEEDSYVDKELSMELADQLPNLRCLISNEMEHGGLRTHAKRVVDTLTGYLGY